MAVTPSPNLETAPCGYLLVDADSRILYVNQTLAKLLQYESGAALADRPVETILTVAGKIFYQTHFFPMLRMAGKADEIFFTLQRKDSEGMPVVCNAVFHKEEDVEYIECVVFPVIARQQYETEILQAKKQAEEALLSNRELMEAKASLETQAIELDLRLNQVLHLGSEQALVGKLVSHDLQESIRKIGLFADKVSLDCGLQDNSPMTKGLEKIRRECQKLRVLTGELEKFLSLNVPLAAPVECRLTGILTAAFEDAKETCRRPNAVLHTTQLPVIKGYPEQLRSLFLCIISNAIQYAADPGVPEVTVTCVVLKENSFRNLPDRYRYTEHVRITIADNGPGFDLAKESNPFVIKRMRHGSTGLSFGLAASKKIVENHSGDISIESSPGQGTRVIISIPTGN